MGLTSMYKLLIVRLFSVSSSVLSVLQTPPVVRKSFILRAAGSISVTKPQSILSAARHKTNAASSTVPRLTWDGAYFHIVEFFSVSHY